MICDFTYTWNIKDKQSQTHRYRNRLIISRGLDDRGKMRQRGQKLQISKYKINKSGGCNAKHGDYNLECVHTC